MATIDHLLDKISNPELRARLQAEIDRLHKQKRFGLIFEDHLPEATLLYEVAVRRGQKVTLKDAPLRQKFEVVSIKDGVAQCVSLDDIKESEDVDVSELVAYANISDGRQSFAVNQLLPFADFGDPIYPYLQSIDKIKNAPDSSLWHEVIEAENFHALQLLAYLYPGQVDCIYIDPPYNTGARDWKYNNDYVDSSDTYRHSKWLSMMRKRLLLAKKLLNPQDSVLIVTIDEKEYNHLGCLLEDLFPEASIQMVTSVISGKGVSRTGQFSRVEEYIYCVTFGNMQVSEIEKNMLSSEEEIKTVNPIEFLGFRRRNKGNFRTSRPNQFYPVIVDNRDGHIVAIGDAITPEIKREDVYIPEGCTGIWPLDPQGEEKIWSVVPESARLLLSKGCLKVVNWKPLELTGSVKYLAAGTVRKIDSGDIIIDSRDEFGSIISGHLADDDNETLRPRRVWNVKSHNASTFGTLLLKKFLYSKRFDFPKSLYAVHDTLRFFVGNKPNALVVDFFAGSGTTLHAVNLLNAEDGGNRRCIMVTNNEVSEDEEKQLKAQGKTPADDEWKALGIARYVTWPRTVASITGNDVKGNAINGEYLTYLVQEREMSRKFKKISFVKDFALLKLAEKKDLVSELTSGDIAKNKITEETRYIIDEDSDISILLDDSAALDWLDEIESAEHVKTFYIITKDNKLFNSLKSKINEALGPIIIKESETLPMADGFKANVEFFHLGFIDKNAVALNRQFKEILPLLWLKAGGISECPQIDEGALPSYIILPKNKFAVLIDETAFYKFWDDLEGADNIDTLYIITNSDIGYREMAAKFPDKITYQLYRDYLDNFRINYTR